MENSAMLQLAEEPIDDLVDDLMEGLDLEPCISCKNPVSGEGDACAIPTEFGPVCPDCFPVYSGIYLDVGSLPFDPNSRRELIESRLGDSEYKVEVQREMLREDIREIVGILDHDTFAHHNVIRLRKIFTSLVDMRKYLDAEGAYPGALPLKNALGCMNEEERTSKFLQGLMMALTDLEAKLDGDIEMLDAGCGPVPLFGSIAAILSDRVNVTCLELNEVSAAMARDIIDKLGLSDRVKVLVADATSYQHEKPVDLLISETMYSGLFYEPQIQIMRNLSPQVNEDGIVLPEWIAVDAALLPEWHVKMSEGRGVPIPWGNYEVEEVARFTRESLDKFVDFALDVPADGSYQISVASRIGIFRALEMDWRDSVITRPVKIELLDLKEGDKVSVHYEPGVGREDVYIEIEEGNNE